MNISKKLVQECRESSVILVEVMNVVWERLRDSRGMQWKHGKFALQIIQDLILHGPLGAVAEATDGLDRIRRMKYYENTRAIATYSIQKTKDNDNKQRSDMYKICNLKLYS